MNSHLSFYTPDEERLREWLKNKGACTAIEQLMKSMSEIEAIGSRLMVRKLIQRRTTDASTIKGWISLIDHVVEQLSSNCIL
jgi:hypothetical protein